MPLIPTFASLAFRCDRLRWHVATQLATLATVRMVLTVSWLHSKVARVSRQVLIHEFVLDPFYIDWQVACRIG